MTAFRTLVTVLLFACHHRPITPAAAPAADPGPPVVSTAPTLQGFAEIDGVCHWAHLDAATGAVLQKGTLPTKHCPNRAIVTTSPEGTTLMAVHFPEHNELWRQQGPAADVVEIPGHPYLELAWMESGRVHATTFDFKMDHVFDEPDPDALQVEPTDEDLEDQWHHDCYTSALTEGTTESEFTWELVREQAVELSEGESRPYCAVGDVAWASTTSDYHRYNFETFEDSASYGELEEGLSWGIVYEMDATKSGEPCLQDCADGELLRRYAFGYMWFEGPRPGGGVAVLDGETWSLLDGLEGYLLEFFLLDEQLIICTDKGFGAWNHAAGTRTWWKESTACPLQARK